MFKKKVIKRSLLIGLIICVILPVSTLVFRNQVASYFLTRVAKDNGLIVNTTQTQFTFFTEYPVITLEVDDLAVSSIDTPDSLLLSMKEGIVKLDVGAFLDDGSILIEQLSLSNGTVNVGWNDKNQLNWPLIESDSTTTDSTFLFQCKDLSLDSISYTVYDDSSEFKLNGTIVEDHYELLFNQDSSLAEIDLNHSLNHIYYAGNVEIPQEAIHLKSSIRFNSDSTHYYLKETQLAIGHVVLEASGYYNINQDTFLLALKNDTSTISELLSVLPQSTVDSLAKAYDVSGDYKFDLSSSGKLFSPQGVTASLEGAIAFSNTNITEKKHLHKISDLEVKFKTKIPDLADLSTASVIVPKAEGMMGDNSFDASLSVKDLIDPEIDCHMNAYLDLVFINEVINAPQLSNVKGNLQVNLEAEGKYHELVHNFFESDNQLTLKLDNISGTYLENNFDKLNGLFIYQDKQFKIKHLTGLIDQSPFDLALNASRRNDMNLVTLKGFVNKLPANVLGEEYKDYKVSQLYADISFIKKNFSIDLDSLTVQINRLKLKLNNDFYSSKGKVIFLPNAIDFNRLMLQKNKSMLRATGNVTSKYEIISSDFLNDISYQVDLLSPSLIKEDLQGLISLNANVYNLSCLVEGKRNLDDIQVNVQNGSLNIPSIYPSPFLFETNYHNSKENSYTLDNLHLSYGKNNIGGHVLLTNLDSLSGKHKESSSIDIYLNGNQFDANPFIAYMGKTKSKSTPTKKRQTSDKLPQLKIYTKLNHVKWGEDEFNKLLVKCHTTSPTTLSIDTLKVDEDGHFMVHGIYDHAAHSLNTQTTIKQFNIKALFGIASEVGGDQNLRDKVSGMINAKINSNVFFTKKFALNQEKTTATIDMTLINGRLINYTPLKSMSFFFANDNLNDVKFDTLSNKIEYKNKSFYIPRMLIKSTEGSIGIGGVQTLDGTFDYRVMLPLRILKVIPAGFIASIPQKVLVDLPQRLFTNKKKEEVNPYEEVENKRFIKSNLYVKVSGNQDDFKVAYDTKESAKMLTKKVVEIPQHLFNKLTFNKFSKKKK